MRHNVIADKSYSYALHSIAIYKILIANKEYVLSKQFLRSSTSIGANVEEALGGISRKDFRAKMSISYKEARESKYWLRLLKDTGYINEKDYTNTLDHIDQILKLLYRIIQSTH